MSNQSEVACWLCGWQGTMPYEPGTTALFHCPKCSSLGELSKAAAEAVMQAGHSTASGMEGIFDDPTDQANRAEMNRSPQRDSS